MKTTTGTTTRQKPRIYSPSKYLADEGLRDPGNNLITSLEVRWGLEYLHASGGYAEWSKKFSPKKMGSFIGLSARFRSIDRPRDPRTLIREIAESYSRLNVLTGKVNEANSNLSRVLGRVFDDDTRRRLISREREYHKLASGALSVSYGKYAKMRGKTIVLRSTNAPGTLSSPGIYQLDKTKMHSERENWVFLAFDMEDIPSLASKSTGWVRERAEDLLQTGIEDSCPGFEEDTAAVRDYLAAYSAHLYLDRHKRMYSYITRYLIEYLVKARFPRGDDGYYRRPEHMKIVLPQVVDGKVVDLDDRSGAIIMLDWDRDQDRLEWFYPESYIVDLAGTSWGDK